MKQRQEIERCTPEISVGLTSEQVNQRTKAGWHNKVKKTVGKSYLAIVTTNVFTFFNFLGLLIFIIMASIGSIENMVFCVVILANTAIGIFQEIRSKHIIEKLSILTAPFVVAVRNGKEEKISIDKVVIDDVLVFENGNQICCDCELIQGDVEVNEAMLTGESDNVKKMQGDKLYSGSFVVAGKCYAKSIAVGADNYVEQLQSKVKKYKKPNSELMKSISGIIKIIALIIFPLGFATFAKNHWINGLDVIPAIKVACGSMIGMVPSGMVLLTSVALAISIIKLARKKCLVQDMYCIEMLARVDTLCLDKTGTITDGSMTVEHVVKFDETADFKNKIFAMIQATQDDNATAQALKNYFPEHKTSEVLQVLPFSSKRKLSAVTFANFGTLAIGASEFMFDSIDEKINEKAVSFMKKGLRVISVGYSNEPITDENVPKLSCVGLIALSDTIRENSSEIIQWFKDNDVAVKVISGDNPLSVSVIAQKVGIEDAHKYVSLDGKTDEQVESLAMDYTVFGRVTPEQKAILVKALKKQGHRVAMTGDGVNDILAMRESDCAISVACGSEAAKSCAHIVLLDNKFSSMPNVVREGRQVVNNIQNSSSLYLMKTTMTVLTTIMLLFTAYTYPFEAQHLYAFEFFINGIPAFFLALRPNTKLIKGKFLLNVAENTLPSGLAVFLAVALTYVFAPILGIENLPHSITTVAMVSMTLVGVFALIVLCYPLDKLNFIAVMCAVVLTPTALFVLIPALLGGVSSDGKTPYIVPISNNEGIFIICTILACSLVLLGIKYLINIIKRRKQHA